MSKVGTAATVATVADGITNAVGVWLGATGVEVEVMAATVSMGIDVAVRTVDV